VTRFSVVDRRGAVHRYILRYPLFLLVLARGVGRNALPDLRALQGLITRKTAGFPIPTSLPQIAPEARRPAAEPSPQSDDARKPAALKDLFKK
jgi:hypothetical protein